ncbi:MAG: translation initiation factor IF-5A [Candidatus Aenigmatarchaeota archaeon]
MEKTSSVIKNLKPGGFVLIDDAPCRVEKVAVSTSGKHGAAKARLDAIGLLDGKRRSIIKPADETIDVPIITKKSAQVLAIVGNSAQLMDLTDYSVFELPIPEEVKDKIKQGEEIAYYEVMGTKTLKPLK